MKRLHLPLAALATLVVSGGAPQAAPWVSLPPLTADPRDLIVTSAQHPPREGFAVLELLEETLIKVDEAGRRTTRYRYIFRVDQDGAVESWGGVSAAWSPWFEGRPELQARVISPDGTAHALDPKTLGEYGTEEQGADVYGDRKQLKGPLPKLAKGCIVEVVVAYRETAPFSKSGVMGLLPLSQHVPVLHTRVVVEAPDAAGLKVKVQGLPGVEAARTSSGGWTRSTVELGLQEPYKAKETGLPPGTERFPSLSYTTVGSWAAPAAEYDATVETRLKGADVAAMATQAVAGAKTRDERIARLVARLHQQIRYTGLEFGDAAIVPATPAETLKRGYGDCKDKATLLVAMLRAVGIPAHVALLRSGEGRDVDPDLPGMGLFNHAIVQVDGPEPLWIDATAEFARPGEPVRGVEGRWALVAAPGTRELVRIPEARPQDNTQLEIREVRLGDRGPATILETTRATGIFEQRYRANYSNRDDKGKRETLLEYAKGAYNAKGIGAFSHSPVKDLTIPFSLELEIKETPQAQVDTDDAFARLNPWALVSRLQEQLKGGMESEGDPVRTLPFRLPEPFTQELRLVVPPPAGYALEVVPAKREVAFGPVSLTCGYERRADGALVAAYRLDSGPRIWTPAQVNEALKAMKVFGEEPQATAIFNQVGEAHLAAGRVKEALKEFRALAQLQPGKALPHLRMARAFLAAGLGEAARDAARKAIKVEPGFARAHGTLGWILQHDLLGRRFAQGWDAKGALEAYRKAKALDPQDAPTRADLAILLEHNGQGVRYGEGADLVGATEEFRTIAADLDNHQFDGHRLIDLCKLGRFQEAVAFGKTLPAGTLRDNWLVVGLVCSLGVDAGLEEASRLIVDGKARRAAFVGAGDSVVRLGKYAEGAQLLLAGANGSEQMSQIRARAELWGKVRSQDGPIDLAKDPSGVVRKLLQDFLAGRGAKADAPKLFSPALPAALVKEASESFSEEVQQGLRNADLPPFVLRDLILSLTQVSTEGDDTRGYKVILRSFDNSQESIYVTRQEGAFRIAAIPGKIETFGFQALWHAERGQLDQARGWLDHARQLVRSQAAEDVFSGAGLARVWTRGQAGDAADIKLAACMMLLWEKDPRVPKLLEGLRASCADARKADQIDWALAVHFAQLKQWDKSLALTARLLAAHPKAKDLASLHMWTLLSAKRWNETLAFLKPWQEEHPDFRPFLSGTNGALMGLGRREDVERELQRQIDRGYAQPSEFNNLAWSHVVRDIVTEKTLEFARSATQGSGASNAAAIHTLATILAELGRTAEAKEALVKQMELRKQDLLDSNEWYVLGRIAEQLEIPEAAQACFGKAIALRKVTDEPGADSCSDLAARRVKAMRGRGAASR